MGAFLQAGRDESHSFQSAFSDTTPVWEAGSTLLQLGEGESPGSDWVFAGVGVGAVTAFSVLFGCSRAIVVHKFSVLRGCSFSGPSPTRPGFHGERLNMCPLALPGYSLLQLSAWDIGGQKETQGGQVPSSLAGPPYSLQLSASSDVCFMENVQGFSCT